MRFHTEYTAAKEALTLSPDLPAVTLGSCFADNIATRMNRHLWKAINPGGTLYNPVSICHAIELFQDVEHGLDKFNNTLFRFQDIWHSRAFGSSFSSSIKDNCLKEFINRQKEFNENLEKGNLLIVTFGTSICYHLRETGEVVGNCHKEPLDSFYEKRLDVEEISDLWNDTILALKANYPKVRIIFTVSPVRHLKNGFIGNSRSKAILQLAVEKICSGNPDCYYFPAYEIMNDDLRDYRFYASDLVHPSEEAVEYIWEKFCATFLDKKGKEILKEGERRRKALGHRPMTGALGLPLTEKGDNP